MRREELFRLIPDENAAMIYFQNKNLIYKCIDCYVCNDNMKLYHENKVFRCLKRGCNTKISLFSDSIFENTKLSLRKILFIIYEWSVDTPISKVAEEYDVSISTCSLWYN